MKNRKGITLIALIITIIVLLILAGVSINVLTGDNGVLSQASKSKGETDKQSIIEDIQMDIASKQAEMLENISVGQFSKILLDYGNIETNTDSILDGKLITNNGNYEISIHEIYSGSLKNETFSQKITPLNYGDKVNYTANGVNDWKIFYNDGDTVFLISSDYIKLSGTESITGKEFLDKAGLVELSSGEYNVYWENPASTLQETNQNDLFRGNGYILKSINKNSRTTATFLNTNNWNEFKDNNNYARYVIGCPTIEMWIDSWNEVYISEKLEYTPNNNGNGYKVAVLGESYRDDGIGGGTMRKMSYYVNRDTDDTGLLYFPHPGEAGFSWNSCLGYWIASPFDNNDTDWQILRVSNGGNIQPSDIRSTGYGIRPVVALDSSIIGTKESNVWQLSK